MVTLSAVVIARDEEKNIAECLEGLSFCDEIVVVDSGSRDRTADIARAAGAKVFENAFVDFASQKNFGVSKASGEWVFVVDADERVSPPLAAEIRETLKHPEADGYTVSRENRLFGRLMRHGANAGDRPLRLARRGATRFKGLVHETIELAMPGRLRHVLRHESTPTVASYMRKLNHYTSLEAQLLTERGEKVDPKKIKRRPVQVFVYRHFFQRGFLDGIEGFLFSVLSAYYEFIRRIKHAERTVK